MLITERNLAARLDNSVTYLLVFAVFLLNGHVSFNI